MIFQTVEKGKEGKETSGEKAGGRKASLADHRAESAALSAQTPLFHLK